MKLAEIFSLCIASHRGVRARSDPAMWHWLHVRDRIANSSDVLAPLRELIEALMASPVATTFFSYSSLNRLCFSASSHFPWVDDGLPVVAPVGDAAYLVGDTRCNLGRAVQLIEATLAVSPIRPFFGSEPHHYLPLVSDCLARLGSALRPHLAQRGAWYDLMVADLDGARRCRVSALHVAFMDATRRLDASWPTLDDAVRAIRRYCEEGASFDELAADPRAGLLSKRDP